MAFDWAANPEKTVEQWTTEGVPGYGRAVIGTPEDAIAQIQSLSDKTGGFGTYLINAWDIAEHEETRRSFELFASEVMPVFQDSNRGREASLDFLAAHSDALSESLLGAMKKARVDHYGDGSPEADAPNYGTLRT